MKLPSRFFGSRVAGRLYLLFVLAALLPLAVSDWLAATAVTDLAREMQKNSQTRATRQVGMQVFERLTSAKALLATLPDVELAEAGAADRIRLPVASRKVFSRLVHFDANQRANWPAGSGNELLAEWRSADHGGEEAAPQALTAEAGSVQATVRIARQGDAPARILMASTVGGRLAWIGELNAEHLWEPVQDAAIDSGWRVVDGHGRSLVTKGDVDLLPAADHGATDGRADLLLVRTALFLGAEFGASEWEFIEQRAAPQARWLGLPLSGWLALVAIATVLLIALVSQRAIRHMLVPLERLTAGTRLLAAGASSTRVAVQSDDEFGTLGNAFNEMASRIEAQFGSLTAMSAIDRDVLAGQPIEHVVGRVLEQLARLYPDLPSAVCWRSAARDDVLHQLVREAGKAPATELSVLPLDAAQADAFAAIDGDSQVQGAAADAPWCGALRSPEVASLQMLPLGWGEGTQALLMVGLPAETGQLDLQPAVELRDRLAVAFSARERERVMLYRAVHDSLTGLANRSGLNEYLDRLLDADPSSRHAALFVDLDHFKDINDSLGHEAGDAILCEAAARLRASVPNGALVARQGGDEFVLVLPQVDAAIVSSIAQRVVDELVRPFVLRDEQHRFGASVGVAIYPQHGKDRIELLRHADLAMYAAKQSGRGRFELFADSLEAAAHERLRIPRELRRDMDLGKLVAYFQARVNPADGRVTSVEALVRWQHPERGLLFPDSFIALAEESSLIEDLGNWMINEACARMTLWRATHPSLQRVSVNVSPRQLASGRLPQVVREALQRHHVTAQHLELEVTESLLVEDSGDVYAQLSELRAMGVCIALDDFGTGFSSMAMLRKLPIDVMKIDRAFVKDLDTDEAALAITRSIAELAHSLGLHLVAEGIENETQARMLRELRCHEFQGYLYSKPLPPGDFSLLCSAREISARASDGVSLEAAAAPS
ncbi:EAL domain-containing protein [Piscinibacter sakaiensis]|uniref:EAL domain-containing protein n=1 Tax=Piscinibacter sakaiensis TaxID=1547922 RepID=UPI003AAAED0B